MPILTNKYRIIKYIKLNHFAFSAMKSQNQLIPQSIIKRSIKFSQKMEWKSLYKKINQFIQHHITKMKALI